jgi:hypothetical protein
MTSSERTSAGGHGASGHSIRPRLARWALFAVAALAVLLAVGAIGRHLGPIVRTGYRSLTTPGRPLGDSDLDPFTFYASTRALSGARAVIPPHATYTIVVGTTKPSSAELPGPQLKVDPVTLKVAFSLWLMPRRYVPLSQAQWVVAYDAPLQTVGVQSAETVTLGPDATVIKVAGR